MERKSKPERPYLCIPAIVYAVAIFVSSSFRVPEPAEEAVLLLNVENALHIVEYLIFGLLLFLAFLGLSAGNPRFKSMVLTAVIGVVYGALDEYHQGFVVGRRADIADFFMDALGIALSIVAVVAYYKVQSRER